MNDLILTEKEQKYFDKQKAAFVPEDLIYDEIEASRQRVPEIKPSRQACLIDDPECLTCGS